MNEKKIPDIPGRIEDDERLPFRIGQKVKIRRRNGEIEDGWSILMFLPKETSQGKKLYAKVIKEKPGGEPGDVFKKDVPLDELRELNKKQDEINGGQTGEQTK